MNSRSVLVIAMASAAITGTYFVTRLLLPSLGRLHSEELSNTNTSDGSEKDPTPASFNGPIFRKAPNANEEAIYRILGSHPRIVRYLGSDPITGDIRLPFLRNGALLSHLRVHSGISISTRLTWAIQIAQGVAHLHSQDVIWADPHLHNILLTDDYDVVLCDFGLSVHKAPYFYNFTTGPPPIYLCPHGYCARTPRRTDIFGLGVILFVLLSERFPFHKDLFPSPVEEVAAMRKHNAASFGMGAFDDLTPLLRPYFGAIVAKCFTIEYQSADSLVTELEAAFSLWWKDTKQDLVSPDYVSAGTPYPQRPVHLPIKQVQHQYTPPKLELSEGDNKLSHSVLQEVI